MFVKEENSEMLACEPPPHHHHPCHPQHCFHGECDVHRPDPLCTAVRGQLPRSRPSLELHITMSYTGEEANLFTGLQNRSITRPKHDRGRDKEHCFIANMKSSIISVSIYILNSELRNQRINGGLFKFFIISNMFNLHKPLLDQG